MRKFWRENNLPPVPRVTYFCQSGCIMVTDITVCLIMFGFDLGFGQFFGTNSISFRQNWFLNLCSSMSKTLNRSFYQLLMSIWLSRQELYLRDPRITVEQKIITALRRRLIYQILSSTQTFYNLPVVIGYSLVICDPYCIYMVFLDKPTYAEQHWTARQ